MDNPNPIYYRDLITPDDSIIKLMAQLDELITKYEGAKTKIQGAAADVAKGMQNVSGATEEQRKVIQLATEQSDRLLQAYKAVDDELLKNKMKQAEANAAQREATQIAKLMTQIAQSQEGSYNRLSAQYRLNKIALNAMSKAQREGTDVGRKLEAETNALYEEMKRLQEATGMHQLNVGNYADAAKGLKMELTSLTQQMAYLKTEGKANSEEYQEMAERAAQLKDAMIDAQNEVKNMSTDTRELDTTMGVASAASGGMAAVAGAINLVGSSSETASEAQKNLGIAVGIVSSLTAVQNALQKESNLMTGIRTIQTKAATKAEQRDTAAKNKNTTATAKATIAQRIFNAVAKANPYVLLAMALITVVGALVAFAVGSNRAAKDQAKLNEQIKANLDYMEKTAEEMTRINNERIKSLQDELEVAKARNASNEETRKIEDEIYTERLKSHDMMMGFWSDEVANVDANRAKVAELEKTLLSLQTAQAAGKNHLRVDVDLDGKLERTKIDKAIEAIQGQIDNYGRSVEIATELKTEGTEIAKERAIQLEQRRQEAIQIAKTEMDVLRSTQDARMALIRDSYKRESEILKANAERQKQDIQTRLRTETNLTAKARKSLNDQILLIEEKYLQDLEDLRNEYAARNLAARRETEDVIIATMAEGFDKEREELRVSYERQIEDITNAIATQRDLTDAQVEEMYNRLVLLGEKYRKELQELNGQITVDELNAEAARIQLRLDATRDGSQEQIDLQIELLKKQREIELAENAQLAEDVRQNEADINAKWDETILRQTAKLTKDRALMLLDMQQEYAASEFALLDKNERQKTEFQLAQERERLQKILDLDAESGYLMMDQERKNIINAIAAIDKERKRLPYNNLYELLGVGLDSDQQSALDTAINSIKDSISSIVDSWNAAADAAINAANKQVEAAQKTLDAEIEARNAGYANDVATAQKELDLARKTQDQATKDKQKAQKAQLAMDTLTQSSSLITATANIWSALGGVPIVGPGLAIAAIASMWTSFLAAKIKAAQVSQTEQYTEGTVELLQGGSHASGHDIDLGLTPSGKRRRAEGGEFFAIINKRNSRRYRNVIPDVINSFNDGTFADRYQRANAAMSGLALQMIGGTDVSSLERDVAAIRKQGDETRFVDGQGNTVVKYKNLTRRIKR